jgi:predicted metal-dependent HD superfamily phosphohydrolase
VERYSEPHRAYHTLQHIGECFAQFDRVHDARAPGEVGLALWFHDAIYDPRASDNEARSAQWARAVLGESGARTTVIEAVERLILATQHDATPQDHDAQIVVDIDLSILGADADRFQEYEDQVRREYEWIEEEAFRRGRTNVLRSFLDRPFIYSTDDFRARLETRARSNLARSIAALSGDSATGN